MDKEEKLKLIYEHAFLHHRYFLDWRNKLFAGYIVAISAIGYFILTWCQKPENYSNINYILICSCGLIASIFFSLINHKITKILWRCQNKAYLIEKELGFNPNGDFKFIKFGLYGRLLHEKIRKELDDGKIEELDKKNPGLFNPLNHTGVLNWFFIIVVFFYIILLFQIGELNSRKESWIKTQQIEKLNKMK